MNVISYKTSCSLIAQQLRAKYVWGSCTDVLRCYILRSDDCKTDVSILASVTELSPGINSGRVGVPTRNNVQEANVKWRTRVQLQHVSYCMTQYPVAMTTTGQVGAQQNKNGGADVNFTGLTNSASCPSHCSVIFPLWRLRLRNTPTQLQLRGGVGGYDGKQVM